MTKERKRRPGGGRKPKGEISGKSAVFSTRITPETRAALEAAARKNGRSLSQEIERRLRFGLVDSRDEPKELQALLHAISHIAKRIAGLESGSWRADAFRAKAFRIAVDRLLEKLSPDGPITTPANLKAFYDSIPGEHSKMISTPEAFADAVMLSLWEQIVSDERINKELFPKFSLVKRDLGL